MHTSALISSGLIAAGLVGGAIVARPPGSREDPRALVATATAADHLRIRPGRRVAGPRGAHRSARTAAQADRLGAIWDDSGSAPRRSRR